MSTQTIQISGLTAEEIEEFRRRAETEGVPLAQWCRFRLRAGARLWDAAGRFNKKEVDRPFTEVGEERPDRAVVGLPRLKEVITWNLSEEEPISLRGGRVSIADIVIEELVTEALAELEAAGEIEYRDGEGYLRASAPPSVHQ